jgi:hypothetical protein
MSNKPCVTFTAYFDGQPKTYEVEGRAAETLLCLVQASDTGITALEVSSWAYRLASYIHDLRHKFGLDIRTQREPHDGGTHGRYVLLSAVEIIRIEQR